jgi:hypothetical protein
MASVPAERRLCPDCLRARKREKQQQEAPKHGRDV